MKISKQVRSNLYLLVIGVLLLAGVSLRVYKLYDIPGGMLTDEPNIFNHSIKAFKSRNWPLYMSTDQRQEHSTDHVDQEQEQGQEQENEHRHHRHIVSALHGYIQHLLPKFTTMEIDSYKVYGLLLSLFIILLVYLSARLVFDYKLSLLITAMFSLNYWHIYASRTLGTHHGVVFLIILSSYTFIRVLDWAKQKDTGKLGPGLGFLFILNLFGFFYFTSFAVVILTQLIIVSILHKQYNLPKSLIMAVVLLGIMCFIAVHLVSGTSFKSVYSIGSWHMPDKTLWGYLTRIGYSVLLPIFKPPLEFYSITNGNFKGDCVSYSFYASTGYLILGLVYSILCVGGLVLSFIDLRQWYKNWKIEKSINLPVFYSTIFYFLFVIIVGTVGPSYAKLLPISILTAFLAGYALNALIISIKQIKYPWLTNISYILVLLVILLIPYESYRSLIRAEQSDVVALWYNKHTVKMLEKVRTNPGGYAQKKKFAYCPVNYQLCKYYTNFIPNLTVIHTLYEVQEYIRNHRQNLTSKAQQEYAKGNKKAFKNMPRESFWLLWPAYPPRDKHFLPPNEIELDFNVYTFPHSMRLISADKVYDQGELIFRLVTLL